MEKPLKKQTSVGPVGEMPWWVALGSRTLPLRFSEDLQCPLQFSVLQHGTLVYTLCCLCPG